MQVREHIGDLDGPVGHRYLVYTAALCGAELKSLGRDAFRAKYTTPGACLKAMAERATAIVEDAQAQCATAQRKLVCVRAGIAKALGLPTRGPRK